MKLRRYCFVIFVLASLLVLVSAQAAPLHDDAARGGTEQVKELIASGANVNGKDTNDRSPWQHATTQLVEDAVKGRTPLHVAVIKGQIGEVKRLVAKGANVNARDMEGFTPLHFAVREGHQTVAELLIEKGANPSATSTVGQTPLHEAAIIGHEGLAKLLISNGADVNAETGFGITPLHLSAEARHIAVVELLIAKGADINAKGGLTGQTPLYNAAYNGRTAVAELLILNGADVNAKNLLGLTPLDSAKKQGHKEMVKLLKRHGAKE
ncbi:MAG: ankyrin repeat domain-containing protein [Planctomycetota bacterium]